MAVNKNKTPKYILNAKNYWADKSILGQRYVFFRSLQETHPSLYSNAKNYFNQLNFPKKLDDNNISDKLFQFQAYRYLLKDLADKERNNEIKYMSRLLEEAKDSLDSEEYQKFSTALNKGGRNVDYLQLIDILNNLRQKDVYKTILSKQTKNLQLLQKNYENQTVEKQNEIEQDYIKNYDDYINKHSKILTAAIKNEEGQIINKFEKSYNQRVTELILQCLRSTSETFEKEVENELQHRNYSSAQLESVIKNIIIDYVLDNIGKTEEIETTLTLANVQQYLDRAVQQTNDRVFTYKESAFKTLESRAIKSGTKLADMFYEFPDTLKEEILEKYDPTNGGNKRLRNAWEELKKALDKTQTNTRTVAKAKEIFSKEFRKLFDAQVKKFKRINKAVLATIPSDKEKIAYILKNLETPLKDGLMKNLRISVLQSNDANEILALASEKQQSELLLGKVIQLKNDVMFSVYFPSTYIEKSVFTDDFNAYFDDFQRRFMEQYAAEGKRTTDVTAAAKAYYDQFKALSDVYNNVLHTYGENSSEAMLAADKLKNTFFASVSAKNYEFYNNNLGFHAGNLGANGRAVEVIQNITKMYDLGGINTLDAELMINAVLNSSEDTVLGANNNILQNIKDYLIGGAALMMFDDGFSNTKKIYDRMKELLHDNAPTQIHLYYLNNVYIPASYVLQNIYENLTQLMAQLEQDYEDISNQRYTSQQVKSEIIIINNVSEAAYQPAYEDEPSTPKRWSIASHKAQEEVKIEFLFMAGLLDIFEQLPNAFNDINT